MPLVPAKCTQCGASLTVDPSKEAAVCPYCSQAYIVEKAINFYNTTNVTNIDTLNADKVIIESSDSAASLLKAGETHIRLKNYTEAVLKFEEMCNKFPHNFRAWYGRLRALTNDFITYEEFKEYSSNEKWDFFTKAMDQHTKNTSITSLKYCADLLSVCEKYCIIVAGETPKPQNYIETIHSVVSFAKNVLLDHSKSIRETYNPIEKHCASLSETMQLKMENLSPRKAKNVQSVLNCDEVCHWSCYREKYIQEIVKLHEETKRAESERRRMWNRLDIELFNKNVEKLQMLQQKYGKEL